MTINIHQADDETVNPNRKPWLRAGLAGFVAVALTGGIATAVASSATEPATATAAGPASAAPDDTIAGIPTTPTTWGPSSIPGIEILPDENTAADSIELGRPGTPAPVGSDTADLDDEPIVAGDGATFGSIADIAAPGTHLDTLLPGYVAVTNPDGTLAGYFKASDMYPTGDTPSLLDTPDGVPVYAADGTTLVGHITRDHPYLPLGVNADDIPPVGSDPAEGGQ
jgi:hypothetical protein